jgi:hypothetical protein
MKSKRAPEKFISYTDRTMITTIQKVNTTNMLVEHFAVHDQINIDPAAVK